MTYHYHVCEGLHIVVSQKCPVQITDNQTCTLCLQAIDKTQLLKKCLQGFEECTEFLKDASYKDEEKFGLLNMILRDKLVAMYNSFNTIEERTVLGNKLARLW